MHKQFVNFDHIFYSGKLQHSVENTSRIWKSNQLGDASGSNKSIIRFHSIYYWKASKVAIFSVSDNSLSGAIPTSLGNLTKLIKLYLNDNNFQGESPPSLGKCENLNELSLCNNNLSGSIPTQLGGLSSLSICLYLSSNHLTGVLPFEVKKLIILGMLDVSQNMLYGVIPNDLGNCIRLEVLLMRGNFFQLGSIPSSLSSLRGHTDLDLSKNNLTDPIPVGGVFKNANATFLEGNNKLCRGIPEFHLPACDNLDHHKERSTLKILIAMVSQVFGATLVFSIMFLFWFRKRRKHPASPNEENPLRLSYQSILKATNGFSSETFVEKGSFRLAYKGVLEDGKIIAMKVLKLLSHGAFRSFLAECESWRNIRHRNLVKVLTACFAVNYNGNDFKALVNEFMADGSLEDWLHPPIDMNDGEEAAKTLNLF
ncbi:hypothetical protein PTKIN_Ptkin16aG0485100 [Pterospermum kingtungense]